MLLHVVADYGAGDLAFAEVCQRLAVHLPHARILTTPVPSFDTISAGFCVAQLALNPGPDERVVFHNVAPRADVAEARSGNRGEELVCARLSDATLVIGPNAGHSFSFVADEALELRHVALDRLGSQFRSRDYFPELVGRLAGGDTSSLGEAVTAGSVPAVPPANVVYVDGYGNLKTSWSVAPVPIGQIVEVDIAGQRALATVTDGSFEVAAGELAFAPGSSGWPSRAGGSRRFYEVFLRGGSAAARFGNPRAGAGVQVRPLGDGNPGGGP